MTLEAFLLAFFANIIPRVSKLGVNIVTRRENYTKPLVGVVDLLIAINHKVFIIRPVDALESSVWVVSDLFKLTF